MKFIKKLHKKMLIGSLLMLIGLIPIAVANTLVPTGMDSVTGQFRIAQPTDTMSIPNAISQLTNDVGFITSGSLSSYLTSSSAASTYATQTALSGKQASITTGTTGQYFRGDLSLATFPSIPAAQIQSDWTQATTSSLDYIKNKPARSFNYPSRALNSCFQISATQDAIFHYRVDVTTGLSLASGAQGTITITSYTNSGCTTGAQALVDGTAAQTGSLVIGLNISQVVSIALDGMTPANRWLKITTANTVGTPTFAIRAAQQEILF